jgi:hypothetical protein
MSYISPCASIFASGLGRLNGSTHTGGLSPSATLGTAPFLLLAIETSQGASSSHMKALLAFQRRMPKRVPKTSYNDIDATMFTILSAPVRTDDKIISRQKHHPSVEQDVLMDLEEDGNGSSQLIAPGEVVTSSQAFMRCAIDLPLVDFSSLFLSHRSMEPEVMGRMWTGMRLLPPSLVQFNE